MTFILQEVHLPAGVVVANWVAPSFLPHKYPRIYDREVWGAWTKDTAIHIASLLQDITGGPWRTGVQHIEHVKSYAPHIHHIVLVLECSAG
uniref:Uncharacterized protein n=1 Tax=Oncorhynchus tshawytscha TaxID=74940 RepID=A0A8C8JTX5_ONCTS